MRLNHSILTHCQLYVRACFYMVKSLAYRITTYAYDVFYHSITLLTRITHHHPLLLRSASKKQRVISCYAGRVCGRITKGSVISCYTLRAGLTLSQRKDKRWCDHHSCHYRQHSCHFALWNWNSSWDNLYLQSNENLYVGWSGDLVKARSILLACCHGGYG